MSFSRNAGALVAALLMFAVAPAMADKSGLSHLPSDCNIAIMVDLEALTSDASIAPMLEGPSSQLEEQGFPPISAWKSAGVGVAIPASFNLMAMQGGMSPEMQPDVYAAVVAGQSLESVEEALSAQGAIADDSGVIMLPEDGAIRFNEAKNTLFFSLKPDNLPMTAGASRGANFVGKAGDVTLGQGGAPFLYVHASGLEAILGQVSAFGGMMLMSQAQTPEDQKQAQTVVEALQTIATMKKLEVAMAFEGEEVVTFTRITLPSAAAAEKLGGSVDALMGMVAAKDPNAAAQLDGMDFEVDGDGLTISNSMPKEEFLANIGMAAQQIGAGAGGY